MTQGFEEARREAFSLIIGIAGGSGGGKTKSALRVARGIAGTQPFMLIDTEARRSRMYADHHQPWSVGDLDPPFTPARYLEKIEQGVAAAPPVIVVDSFSHEHEGEGGLLDMQEAEVDRMAGPNADWNRRQALAMAGWIKPKREHKRLMRRLTRLNTHVIVCLRAEEKVEMRRDDAGKMEVVPVVVASGAGGWVPICEKRLPYELTLSLLVTPDAPGIPKPIKLPEDLKGIVPLDRVLDEEVGARLAEWARGTAPATADAPDPDRLEALEAELLELTNGREDVREAIERAAMSKSPSDYVGWLEGQIARFKAAAAS